MSLQHSSFFRPRVFQYEGALTPRQMDRIQDLTGTVTLNRDKIKEVGRDGTVGYKDSAPTANVTIRQLEYGAMDFWNDLANKADATTVLTHNDFKNSAVDIAGFKTNDDGVFTGTVVYPKLRMSGFSMNIGDPDALVERNFTLVGEDEYSYQGNNKYYIQLMREVESGESGTISIDIGGTGDYLNYPAPVADPDQPTKYFQRVTRERAGEVTELALTTDYTFTTGTRVLAVLNCLAGDVIKAVYTATTYIVGATPFTNNDVDLSGITADSCSLFLNVNNYAFRIQSASMDISFERADQKEIGNKEVVSRGIRSRTVTITLGRTLDDLTIEEVLRGVSANYGKIDAREFADDISFTLQVYSDNTKSTFLMGYKFENLTPSNLDENTPVDEYVTRNVTLTGEEVLITNDVAELA